MIGTAVSKFGSVLVLGFAVLVAASPAAALSSVGLEWRGTGGATTVTVTGTGAVTLIADVTLTVESGQNNVNGVFVSFLVDEDSQNELNVVGGGEFSTVKLPGMANTMKPIVQGVDILESPLGGPALIEKFDQGSLSGGLSLGTVTLGSIKFSTNAANLGDGVDGFELADVRVLVQQNGFDAISDSSGARCIGNLPRNDCPYEFGELFVNAPEPTTSALLLMGLGVGVFYSRRR